MLDVSNVSKTYLAKTGPIHAVKSISFSMKEGSITGLIGPNGAGKSTLMRLIAMIQKQNTGTIRLQGFDTLTDTDQAKSCIGYISVETQLYEMMTPWRLLNYFGGLYGMDKKTLSDRISELAQLFSFEDALHRNIGGFSTGMKQKVTLARGILHRPKFVIMDEPTNGLDLLSAHQLRETIRQMKKEGTAVLLSTHIVTDLDLCDQLIMMHQGSIIFDGSAQTWQEKDHSLEQFYLRTVAEYSSRTEVETR